MDEMLNILDAFEDHEIFFVTNKSKHTEKLHEIGRVYYIADMIDVSSFVLVLLTRLLQLFLVLIPCIKILLKEKPSVIVSCGGAGTVPLCYLGKLTGAKVIYITSLTRIKDLSYMDKIVYPIVDLFLVQWEHLADRYKKAKFWGRVV